MSCNRRRPLKYRIVECSEDAVAQCAQNKSDKNGFILSRVGRMFIQNNSQLESVVDGMVRGSVEESNCFRNQNLTVCLKNAVYNITLCSSNDERGKWGMVQSVKVKKKLRNCLTRVTRRALENICSEQLSEEQSVGIINYYCSKLYKYLYLYNILKINFVCKSRGISTMKCACMNVCVCVCVCVCALL